MQSRFPRVFSVFTMLLGHDSIAAADPAQCAEGHACPPIESESLERAAAGQLRLDSSPPPPPVPRRRLHAWSLRLLQRFSSAADNSPEEQLTGLGLSYRVRPMAWLGVEPALDLFRGYDVYDSVRTETNLSTDLLFYLNPQHAVQVFALTGAGVGWAHHSEAWAQSEASYLGVRLGAGLEFRVTHRVSFNVNAVGYSRHLAGARLRNTASANLQSVPDTTSGLEVRASGGVYF